MSERAQEDGIGGAERRDRVDRLRTAMDAAGLTAYVATRQSTVAYLGGIFAPWRTACVVTPDRIVLLVWRHDGTRLTGETWIDPADVVEYTSAEGFTAGLAGVLSDALPAGERVGLEIGTPGSPQIPPGVLAAAELDDLRARLPALTLVDALDVGDELVLRKSDAEIRLLRRAAAAAEEGFRAGLRRIAPGVRENQVAGAIEAAAREHGSEWAWSVTGGTEVGAGPRTAYLGGVTQPATERVIQRGDNVILDVHTMCDLYLSDVAGNAVVGPPSRAQRELRDVWKGAVDTLLAGIRPGEEIAATLSRARAGFDDAGYGAFGLSLFGHGLGTCARTTPRMNLANRSAFASGMVIALGTHVYRPDVGGMRLEQPLLITEDGAEPLSEVALDWHVLEG